MQQRMTSLEDVVADEFVPTDRPMRIGRYTLGAILGEGKSAYVRRGTSSDDRSKVAIKILNKLAGPQGSLIMLQFQQETEALRRISHPHVITMLHFLQSQRRFYIVLELLRGDLLSYHVERRCGLPEHETREISSQLTSALAYLHKCYVVHRDLKPGNIMLAEDRIHVKIIDFGLSATCSCLPQLTRKCGTPAYMAPEVLTSMGYGCLVDMWSLGVTIVEVLTGYTPHLHSHYKKGTYPKLVQRREMLASLPPVSRECQTFLSSLLQMFPEKRMTSQEATTHEWISPKVRPKSHLTPRSCLGTSSRAPSRNTNTISIAHHQGSADNDIPVQS